MKFGVREICDVVLKAKANQKIGNKIFYKNEPVLYFDTLKTSSMEGAATTVYAQGGRGNARLVAWEGERTVTFTMEDALISPLGFSILSGAGLIDADSDHVIYQHMIEQTDAISGNVGEELSEVIITLEETPAHYDAALGEENDLKENEDYIYVMVLDANGEVTGEPFIASYVEGNKISVKTGTVNGREYTAEHLNMFKGADAVLVDYYVARTSNAQQIEITAEKFGGTYYLEASTLFRDAATGKDMPAEFIIPKCKIQSNFTFSMASSGDPSTFTFTMDAFPDYTRFDRTKKVLAAIQIMSDSGTENELRRAQTLSGDIEDSNGIIVRPEADDEE
jgi:hypothetical protein